MFQKINDAYYTLSDPTRRKEYDEARSFHNTRSGSFEEEDADEEIPRPPPSASGPSWANMFGFGRTAGATSEEQFANDQFKNAFEEMMAEDASNVSEGRDVPNSRIWSILGGVSGGILGFIGANVVGAVPGFVIGSKFGAIRDAKGKSVYEVFQSLPQDHKAKILSELAAKVLSGAIS